VSEGEARAAGELPPGPPAPGEPVIATVAVGPPVRGPRTAVAAVARYGADPVLSAGPWPLDRAAWGAGQVLWAARLAWRDRALRRAALWPVVLTALGCGVLAALYTWHDVDAVHPLVTLHLYMSVFVGLASMPPTLLLRQWSRVANEARRALGLPPGEDPFAGRPLVRVVAAEWVKALRQAAVVAVGLLPVILALEVLPDAVHAPAVVAGLWAFYWGVVDAFELPMEVLPGRRVARASPSPRRRAKPASSGHGGPEPWFARLLVGVGRRSRLLGPVAWAGRLGGRLARPWREELHFTERHRWETAGMGIAAGALLSLPVLGLAFRAVAIVAATALVSRDPGADRTGTVAAEAPAAAPDAPAPAAAAVPVRRGP
jgi:hypothetical protein